MYAAIDSNEKISGDTRELVRGFCRDYVTNQPDAERRVLLYNLGTLTIEFADELEMIMKSWDASGRTEALYDHVENSVTLNEDRDFIPGTWDYQCLYHELSHAARSAWSVQRDGIEYDIKPGGAGFNSTLVEETLNTLFSVSLYDFDYEEESLAYKFPSNTIRALISSMDNYKISDYTRHSTGWFVARLDECDGNRGRARDMLLKLEKLREIYLNKKWIPFRHRFYPVFDFVSDVYYKDRIHAGMSYREAKAVADELVATMMHNETEPKILRYSKYMHRYFDRYCRKLGIRE